MFLSKGHCKNDWYHGINYSGSNENLYSCKPLMGLINPRPGNGIENLRFKKGDLSLTFRKWKAKRKFTVLRRQKCFCVSLYRLPFTICSREILRKLTLENHSCSYGISFSWKILCSCKKFEKRFWIFQESARKIVWFQFKCVLLVLGNLICM